MKAVRHYDVLIIIVSSLKGIFLYVVPCTWINVNHSLTIIRELIVVISLIYYYNTTYCDNMYKKRSYEGFKIPIAMCLNRYWI